MGFKRGRKFTKNKKVRNATPLEVDGIGFKSRLEAFTYRNLKESGIIAAYEENRYTLIEPFEYNGEKIRACTYTPDFVGDGFVIEVKGFSTDTFNIKWKMFKDYLRRNEIVVDLYLPRNQKDVLSIIEQIKGKIEKEDNEVHTTI